MRVLFGSTGIRILSSTERQGDAVSMQINVVTLFPEMLDAVSRSGITGRAVDKGLVKIQHWNPRDYAKDKHRSVDRVKPHAGERMSPGHCPDRRGG